MRAKFEIGELVVTPQAESHLTPRELARAIARHTDGDWGLVPPEDKDSNDASVVKGEGTLHSAYRSLAGERFWVVTEADRSVTTVLMPDDY